MWPNLNLEEPEIARLLASSAYLRKKYDRHKGLAENLAYIERHIPWLMNGPGGGNKLVVDVGPGFGWLMEWCREFHWDVVGYESQTGEYGMGDEYLDLAKIVTRRLPIERCGFEEFLKLCAAGKISAELIHFRGSWAQCWHSFAPWCQEGPPHHEHHDVARQQWVVSENLVKMWAVAMSTFRRCCNRLHLAVNRLDGEENRQEFVVALLKAADRAGWVLAYRHQDWVFQFRRAKA